MSFISVEPQSRVFLESHNNNLLAQFDAQLRIIADRYLAFFEERRSIEATYINSLRELYRKAKTVDASFNSRSETTTTRTAWDKVRENLGRDADVQQSFMDILANEVIKPLEILKESNDKAINRIKSNITISASRYIDHAENKVLKLQEAYLRKYQSQQYAYPANVSQRPKDVPNKRLGSSVPTLSRGQREDRREPELTKAASSEEVSEDDCREAVATLNRLRLLRAEDLGEGYDSLEELVFAPTIGDVLVKYTGGMKKACAKRDENAKSTGAEVENALRGRDTSDLKVSFRQALSFSIPPLTRYRYYRPGGYSNLILGVPLVDQVKNEDNVPKVMRMCIAEIENRGLNVDGIYPFRSTYGTDAQKLRHRFENENSFSFSSTDNIHSVTALLRHYLWCLPEPLLVLSLRECRNYAQHRSRYTENNFSLLRLKIRELHPVHRASLEALLRHLLRVASHSDKNGLTVKVLSARLWRYVLGAYEVLEGAINTKELVVEDLIQNAHTLFDERPSQSPTAPSSDVAETTSTHTHGSLFLNPEFPQSAGVQAAGSTSRHRPGLVGSIPSSNQSTFSSFPSDGSVESRLTPPLIDSLSPLRGLSSSNTLTEGLGTTTQLAEQVIPKATGTEAIRTLPTSTPPDVVPLPAATSVTEWRSYQSRLPPDPEALRRPQSPTESDLSNMSDISATSLDTRVWGFSP